MVYFMENPENPENAMKKMDDLEVPFAWRVTPCSFFPAWHLHLVPPERNRL
jgi:hypothetical protein